MTFRYLYRGVLEQVQEHDPEIEYLKQLQNEFNSTLDLFNHIMPAEEEETAGEVDLFKD